MLTGFSGRWSDVNQANLKAMLTSELFSWRVTVTIMVLAPGSLVAAGLPPMRTILGLVAAAGLVGGPRIPRDEQMPVQNVRQNVRQNVLSQHDGEQAGRTDFCGCCHRPRPSAYLRKVVRPRLVDWASGLYRRAPRPTAPLRVTSFDRGWLAIFTE